MTSSNGYQDNERLHGETEFLRDMIRHLKGVVEDAYHEGYRRGRKRLPSDWSRSKARREVRW